MSFPPFAASREDQVFDRPLHLAGLLDNAADDLDRTWFGYEWNDRTRCNCGIVARQVLQTNAAGLKRALPPIYEVDLFLPTWRSMTQTYCADSGLPRNEVFARLLAAGLRAADFSHLEELSSSQIVSRMTPHRKTKRAVLKSRKSDVVAYLRAWALGIEQFRDKTVGVEAKHAPVEI